MYRKNCDFCGKKINVGSSLYEAACDKGYNPIPICNNCLIDPDCTVVNWRKDCIIPESDANQSIADNDESDLPITN